MVSGKELIIEGEVEFVSFLPGKNCFWVQTLLPSYAFARKCFEKYKETLLSFPCGTTYERERDLEHHGLMAGNSYSPAAVNHLTSYSAAPLGTD